MVDRNWPELGAGLGFGLAVIALALLAVAPLGWRLGWWHFRFAFFWLMPASGLAGLAAALISLATLGLGWSRLGWPAAATAGIGLVLGALLVYVPWQYNRTRGTVPRIHDITTDTDNPPTFTAALPARAAEKANPVAYEGSEVAALQKAAYPDLAPATTALAPDEAFRRALAAAREMPGWTIVAADAATGRLEANETSRWFGFTDDIVIRVAADGAGSRIDMRSVSRQGRSDFGVNARRIRAYMAALRPRIA